ncbi:MAG: M14 family metallopeptidase [Elusimicrobiota bacterium]
MKPLALAAAALLAGSYAGAASDSRFDGRAGLPSVSDAGTPAPATPAEKDFDGRYWVVIAAGDAASRSAVANTGISIEELRPGRIAGFAAPRALARAQAAGLKVLSADRISDRVGALGFPAGDKAYHDYAQTVAELKSLAAKAPDIASLYSIGKTLQGRDIWALRLCPDAKGSAASKLPGALFIGEHHAREHLSNEVPLALAGRLVDGRNDPEIKRLLATRDITIVPMLNADGAEYDIDGDKYHMHRKNMAANGDGSLGVDLNRNYGWGWGGEGASADPSDETYRGPSAFSEPETQAVKAFIEAHSNIKVLLTYHTFSELVLYPWGGSNAPIDDADARKAYEVMAGEMGRMTGYTPEQSSALYVASGDLCDWSWGEHKIYSFTFEMTPKSMWDGGFYPGTAAIAKSVQLNWRPMLYLIDLADDPLRAGRSPELAAFSFKPAPAAVAQ